MLYLPCVDSYRVSEKIINRVRWQEEGTGIKHRTIANIIEKEGNQIAECIENKVTDILKSNGFNKNGTIKDKDILAADENAKNHFISEDNVISAVESYNDGKAKELQIELTELHESFEDPESCINASVDDVGAKKQKESGRSKYSGHKQKGTRQFVKNTVMHIQNTKNSYIINTPSILRNLKWLIAFLLNNNLVNRGVLVFFVDGADDLRSGIQKLFGWINYKIVLDWYHLKKKCEQRLSLSIRGTINRNMVLDEVLTYLWIGKVDAAVGYLRTLNIEIVKDADHIEKLIAYFDRNWSYIPCYALRKCLRLRNSSNRGEKSNHLVVSDRQKKNGMSWSKDGSVALATVTTIHLNNEKDNWIKNRSIEFKFPEVDKCA